MENLKKILAVLSSKEIDLVRKMYTLKGKDSPSKAGLFYKLCLDEKITSDEEASIALYQKKPNTSYYHLKARVKKDILNCLILHDSNNQDSTEFTRARFDARKIALQGESLLIRGLDHEARRLLGKGLKMALKYELFAEIIRIKDTLRTTQGFRLGINDYERYSKDILYYIREYEKYLIAKAYHFKINLPHLFVTNKKHIYLEFAKFALNDLESMFDEDSSDNFKFRYYLIAISYYQFIKEFENCQIYAQKINELLKTSKVLKSNVTTIGGANLTLSTIYNNLNDFETAITHAKISVTSFKSGMLNELRAMEKLFFAYFHNEDLKNAQKVVKKALKHKQIRSKFLKDRWSYYNANVLYAQGNLKEALRLLRRNNNLTKDKSGWLIGYKLSEMMMTVEEDDHYWLGFQLNNFNQLLSRQKNQNIARSKVIYKLLRILLKNKGNFKKTAREESKRIKLLSDGKDQMYWDPESFEIIRFDRWFMHKAGVQVSFERKETKENDSTNEEGIKIPHHRQ